jgi:hypothetical protein
MRRADATRSWSSSSPRAPRVIRRGHPTSVPTGTRLELRPRAARRPHRFANVSGEEAQPPIKCHPGGFEELFITDPSEERPPPGQRVRFRL